MAATRPISRAALVACFRAGRDGLSAFRMRQRGAEIVVTDEPHRPLPHLAEVHASALRP